MLYLQKMEVWLWYTVSLYEDLMERCGPYSFFLCCCYFCIFLFIHWFTYSKFPEEKGYSYCIQCCNLEILWYRAVLGLLSISFLQYEISWKNLSISMLVGMSRGLLSWNQDHGWTKFQLYCYPILQKMTATHAIRKGKFNSCTNLCEHICKKFSLIYFHSGNCFWPHFKIPYLFFFCYGL